jgi:hypothetical protein
MAKSIRRKTGKTGKTSKKRRMAFSRKSVCPGGFCERVSSTLGLARQASDPFKTAINTYYEPSSLGRLGQRMFQTPNYDLAIDKVRTAIFESENPAADITAADAMTMAILRHRDREEPNKEAEIKWINSTKDIIERLDHFVKRPPSLLMTAVQTFDKQIHDQDISWQEYQPYPNWRNAIRDLFQLLTTPEQLNFGDTQSPYTYFLSKTKRDVLSPLERQLLDIFIKVGPRVTAAQVDTSITKDRMIKYILPFRPELTEDEQKTYPNEIIRRKVFQLLDMVMSNDNAIPFDKAVDFWMQVRYVMANTKMALDQLMFYKDLAFGLYDKDSLLWVYSVAILLHNFLVLDETDEDWYIGYILGDSRYDAWINAHSSYLLHMAYLSNRQKTFKALLQFRPDIYLEIDEGRSVFDKICNDDNQAYYQLLVRNFYYRARLQHCPDDEDNDDDDVQAAMQDHADILATQVMQANQSSTRIPIDVAREKYAIPIDQQGMDRLLADGQWECPGCHQKSPTDNLVWLRPCGHGPYHAGCVPSKCDECGKQVQGSITQDQVVDQLKSWNGCSLCFEDDMNDLVWLSPCGHGPFHNRENCLMSWANQCSICKQPIIGVTTGPTKPNIVVSFGRANKKTKKKSMTKSKNTSVVKNKKSVRKRKKSMRKSKRSVRKCKKSVRKM